MTLPSVNLPSLPFSAVFAFSAVELGRPRAHFSIRKKKLLLQIKEIFFDRLTPIRLLSILHSQFSALHSNRI
jgi:hypothetical protein